MSDLRRIPSVEHILQSPQGAAWLADFGRLLTLQAVRAVLEEVRRDHPNGQGLPDWPAISLLVDSRLGTWSAPSLVTVINATGVILHTNLGRAPLSQEAIQAMQAVAGGYSNLEYDLASGKRGSRLVHAEALLQQLTGAEAALVVNNNAAAVLLILTALARRRAVVIARSQLVEIGGGFRVPDVMKQSGARLVEIGATNRVYLSDYTQAIQDEKASLVMRAHRSNFRLVGFTSEPDLAEIAAAAHQAEIPLVDDLGSGTLLDTGLYGLAHEPTVAESLRSGADLVCFSGDKLLGGPQAGIILGRADLVSRLKKHPLARPIRADKLCLAALTATLGHYLRDEAALKIPVWRMIAFPAQALAQRVQAWVDFLQQGQVIPGLSTIGGGSLPGETLPTFLLALAAPNPNRILEKLRRQNPPIIARLEDDRLLFDPRTVQPQEESALLHGLSQALAPAKNPLKVSLV